MEQLQVWLRAAGRFYESIPVISAVDGIFGAATENAVKAFQNTFNLTADGIVGQMTWRQLQSVYSNLEGRYQCRGQRAAGLSGRIAAGRIRRRKCEIMQNYLNAIGRIYTGIPTLVADGIYGSHRQCGTYFSTAVWINGGRHYRTDYLESNCYGL